MATTTGAGMTRDEKFVVFASSTGTVFEWYDFYPLSQPMLLAFWCDRLEPWCLVAWAT
jgi:hypothetical protein